MVRRKTRIFFYGSPPIVYGGSGFYKFLTSRDEYPFVKILKKLFDVEVFTWTKRAKYKLTPKTVYLIDALPLVYNVIKKSVDKDLLVVLGYPALLEFVALLFVSKLRRVPIFVRDTHWYWPQTRISRFLYYIYYRLIKKANSVITPGKASYNYWRSLGLTKYT